MAERVVEMRWRGPIARFLQDTTPEISLEGGLSSGKTTACLWKVWNSLHAHPGIHWWIGRYGDGETQTKVRPAFEMICQQAGSVPAWNAKELAYDFSNGSKCYAYGLKSPDALSRYSKMRGMGVAGVYCDQAEELPEDFSLELRLRLRQPGFPHQLIFSPNPPNVSHWLAAQFPEDQHVAGRRYYAISIHDNAHNLPVELLNAALMAYPPDHAKHRSVILGKRGMNVTGTPVYKGAFLRAVHEGPVAYDRRLPLEMALDFGKHHPCVVFRQVSALGQRRYLGGILGQNLYLDDFLTVVLSHRAQWFPDPIEIKECCDPAGAADTSHGTEGAVQALRAHGIRAVYVPDSNSPAVRLAMVERMAGQMRTRAADYGEAFLVNADRERWLTISAQSTACDTFLADGFEAGYVWDEHMVSVGNKQVRKPKKDGWYEHGMNCFASDTDVLTDSGWRRFYDLSDLDTLATVNLDTDGIEYYRPSRLIRQEYQGPMRALAGKLDGLVTPDHRMVIYPHTNERERPEPQMVAACDLRPSQRIKLSAQWLGARSDVLLVPRTKLAAEKELDPGDWAEFLGWYVAEGYYTKRIKSPGWGYRVGVAQTKPEGVAHLERLLARLPWTFHRVTGGFTASSEQLWRVLAPLGDTYTKSVPAWIRWASPALIQRFLDGAIAGDGHVSRKGHRQYFTVSGVLADQMQELFIKAGRSASIRVKAAHRYDIRGRQGDSRQQFHLNEWETEGAVLRHSSARPTFTDVPYEGMVYCATVPTGTLIVRRNGRPFVAGNCTEYLELNFGWAPPKAKKAPVEAGALPSHWSSL